MQQVMEKGNFIHNNLNDSSLLHQECFEAESGA
jgi:hypothetical protein